MCPRKESPAPPARPSANAGWARSRGSAWSQSNAPTFDSLRKHSSVLAARAYIKNCRTKNDATVLLYHMCPRKESNLGFKIRNLVSYPLNDEGFLGMRSLLYMIFK